MSSSTSIRARTRIVWIAGVIAVATGVGHAQTAVAADRSASPTPAAALLPVGMRITWEAGDQSSDKWEMVPQASGEFEIDGVAYTLRIIGGTAGVGLEQLDVVANGPEGLVGAVSTLVNTRPGTNVHVRTGASRVVADAAGLGVYWTPPDRLASMQTSDGVLVNRITLPVGDQTFDAVDITLTGVDRWERRSYDAASGLLLQSVELAKWDTGATSATKRLIGVRELDIPWAPAPLPPWAVAGQTLSYEGQLGIGDEATSRLPYAVDHVFDQQVGNVVLGHSVSRWTSSVGSGTEERTSPTVYAVASLTGLWIPPDDLARLQPGQVLDDDTLSGQTISFTGVDQGMAVIVQAGLDDRWEGRYDVETGVLMSSRSVSSPGGISGIVLELSLVPSGR